jgi:hypothetical protein
MRFATTPAPAACPSALPDELVRANVGLDAADADCGCSCDGVTPTASCTFSVLNGCNTAIGPLHADIGTCQDDCYQFRLYSATPNDATCGRGSVTSSQIPPPTWQLEGVGCTGTGRGSCAANETCLPQADGAFADPCVARSGDHDCPGTYPNKVTYFNGFDDTRACSCSCEAKDVTCALVVENFLQGVCTTNPMPVTIEVGDCVDMNGACRVTSHEVSGTCEPGRASTTGAATPTDPVTVCCR